MSFSPSEITLFGVVAYDHASGRHVLKGVQTNPVVVDVTVAAVGHAVLSVVGGGLDVNCFKLARDEYDRWQVAFDTTGLLPAFDAAPFVDNATVTVTVTLFDADENRLGDYPLKVHLRALSGLELRKTGGGTALLGAPASNLRASGWFFGSDNALHVIATPGSGSTSGMEILIDAPAGDVDLLISPSASPSGTDPTARFDGTSTFVLPDGATSVFTGMTQPRIIEDAAPPSITVTGLPNEIGVSPGTAKVIDFDVAIEDDGYFSLAGVTITFRFTERSAAATVVEATYGWSGGAWALTAGVVPAGITLNMPSPVVADADKPPIDPTKWGGVYADAAHSARRAVWGGIQVQLQDGRYERFEVSVAATDHTGNPVPAAPVSRTVLVSIPTDVVLCLDYSGSMASAPAGGVAAPGDDTSKWDIARLAANRFHAVYQAISPAIGGADELENRIGYARFFWQGLMPVDGTHVESLAPVGEREPGELVGPPVDPPGTNLTPIATGIRKSCDELTRDGGWRRRVVIAMTDGYENRGPTIADIRTIDPGDPNFIKNLDDDPEKGVIIHSCAFGADAGVDAEKMDWLATGSDGGKHFHGRYHSTATASDADDRALTTLFLDMLVDTVPAVNRLGVVDADSGAVDLEDGIRRAVFLITDDRPATLTGPSAGDASEKSAAGMRWWAIDNPAPGTYGVTLASAPADGPVELHAVVDLELRADFRVEGQGTVGSTLVMKAHITDGGRPVSGADVWVNVRAPGRSDGELVTRFTKVLAQKKAPLAIKSFARSSDALHPRASLVNAALAHFGGASVEAIGNRIRLVERPDRPGWYEASFRDTSKEGSYRFELSARGKTHANHAFVRSHGVSRYLGAAVSPTLSGVRWTALGRDLWRLVVEPMSVSGYPIGGGKALAVQLGKERETLSLADTLDGSYTATVRVKEGQPLPPVVLVDGARRVALEGRKPDGGPRLIRVTLRGLEVKEVKEDLKDGVGELSFDAVVAPGLQEARAVRRRFPEAGVIELRPGQRVEANALLFEGYVEEGAPLLVTLGGREHDWTACEEKLDPYATYRRVFRGPVDSWAGEHGPGDEKRDPEELADWRVWLRIDVL